MLSAEKILDTLPSFTGTDGYHRFSTLFPKVLLTDGAQYVAESCEAFWLMDVIANHIPTYHKKTGDRFAVVALKPKGSGWIFTLDDGNDNIIITQGIPCSDFPLPEGIKLYVEFDGGFWVIMLPSEY